MQEETIRVESNANLLTSEGQGNEFVYVPSKVQEQLKETKGYSDELTEGFIHQVTALVNSPHAIQRQPTLTEATKVKFFVASKNAKGGYYCCTLHKTHVTCACNSYKYDSVCKHSIAVAVKENVVESHLQNIKQSKRGSRASLVQPTDDNCAGKKGNRNKNPWPASRSCTLTARDQQTTQAPDGFTPAIYHNDKPFVFTFLEDETKAKECRKCRTGLIRRTKIITFDIVVGHEEGWMYPDPEDNTKWVPSTATTTKYYCVRKNRIVERFPYFNPSFLEIWSTTKEKLQASHRNILEEQLGYEQ